MEADWTDYITSDRNKKFDDETADEIQDNWDKDDEEEIKIDVVPQKKEKNLDKVEQIKKRQVMLKKKRELKGKRKIETEDEKNRRLVLETIDEKNRRLMLEKQQVEESEDMSIATLFGCVPMLPMLCGINNDPNLVSDKLAIPDKLVTSDKINPINYQDIETYLRTNLPGLSVTELEKLNTITETFRNKARQKEHEIKKKTTKKTIKIGRSTDVYTDDTCDFDFIN